MNIGATYSEALKYFSEALKQAFKAIELDPNFALAYKLALECYIRRKARGIFWNREQETAETVQIARRAAEVGKDDASALCWAGFALAYVAHDLDSGADLIDRAVVLNPNLADAWFLGGWVKSWLGEATISLKHTAHAMRLSPVDPRISDMWAATASAHFVAGRYDEASLWAEKSVRHNSQAGPAARLAAVSLALAGRVEQAQKAMAHVLQIDPALRMSNAKDRIPPYRPNDLARYIEGLRMAGLPE